VRRVGEKKQKEKLNKKTKKKYVKSVKTKENRR
jgi:hypothetical protein